MSVIYVKRDGKRVSPALANENDAFEWVLNHQGQSYTYAMQYGGYSLETVDNVTETATETSNYSQMQLDRLGTAPEDIRVKFTSMSGETKWLSIPAKLLPAIRNLLGTIKD